MQGQAWFKAKALASPDKKVSTHGLASTFLSTRILERTVRSWIGSQTGKIFGAVVTRAVVLKRVDIVVASLVTVDNVVIVEGFMVAEGRVATVEGFEVGNVVMLLPTVLVQTST